MTTNAVTASWMQRLTAPDYAFAETIAFIEQNFRFNPTAFRNGEIINSAEQNQGSCRILALATMLKLTNEQTLLCFGEYYRDVVATPDGSDHQNIRQLMKTGLEGVQFEGTPLTSGM